jgi:endonuclease/exonuclease/phosphatase family metal-dependent hydrolase
MQPDVVMFNEVEKLTESWGNQDQPEVYKNLLQQKTGKTWYYVAAQEFGQWNANGKANVILSSVPIQFTNRYLLVSNGDRSIAEAAITWNGRKITLISTHLDPYDAVLRLAQATEVSRFAAPEPENKILTGDMNAWPDQASILYYNTALNDSWTVALGKGTATAFAGNKGNEERADRLHLFSRASPNLTVTSSQVFDTRDGNGVMPSDHRPVLTTFRSSNEKSQVRLPGRASGRRPLGHASSDAGGRGRRQKAAAICLFSAVPVTAELECGLRLQTAVQWNATRTRGAVDAVPAS